MVCIIFCSRSLILRNGIDLTTGTDAVDRYNKDNLESLAEDDEVIVLVHGIWQNRGAFRRTIEAIQHRAKITGRNVKVVAFEYDHNDPLDRSAKQLTDFVENLYNKTKTGVTIYGHSWGGTVAVTADLNHGLSRYTNKIVTAETGFNGGKTDTFGKMLVGGLPEKEHIGSEKGRKTISLLNTRPGYSDRINVQGLHSELVPIEDGRDLNTDKQVYTIGRGHFYGSGVEPSAIIPYVMDSEPYTQTFTSTASSFWVDESPIKEADVAVPESYSLRTRNEARDELAVKNFDSGNSKIYTTKHNKNYKKAQHKQFI